MDTAPIEIGDYTVTISIPDSDENYKHTDALTLSFSILAATEIDAQYQTEENGEWISGTLEQALSDVYEGGTVKLMRDVSLTRTATAAKQMTIISVDSDDPCTITSNTDQHGYLLNITSDVEMKNVIVDGGSKNEITAKRAAIAVNDGKLTLGSDAIVQNNNNEIENGAGGGICVVSGELDICGGKITGNQAYFGGGVAVMTGAKVEMTSGSISQNKSTSGSKYGGGGVFLSYGDFDLNGGEIAENTALRGGGVYILDGTLTVNGGEILGNKASAVGGAVYINLDSNLDLNGGKVCNNSATNFAGGIECAPTSNVKITGNPIVTGNTSGEETNGGVYPDGSHNGGYYPNITIGEMDDDATVNFYTWLKRDGFILASPVENYVITADDLSKLSFEDKEYSLKFDDSGNIVLTNVGVYQITFDANGGSLKTKTYKTADGKLINLPTPTRRHYTFDGWFTAADGGEQITTETIFNADTTVYAHWTKSSSGDNSSGSGSSSDITYSIIVENNEYGNVTASTKWAGYGDTVTIIVAPDKGYTIETLNVIDKNGTEIEVIDNENGEYTFEMPNCNVTVVVKFVESYSESAFSDVSDESYYYDAVMWAYKNGITKGVGNDMFAPDWSCTRAEIVTFLWRIAGAPKTTNNVSKFTDVVADSYYYAAVEWAEENGITKGTTDTTFSPDEICTRAQAITLLFRYAAANGMDFVTLQELVSGYNDAAQVPGYALSAFNWALANGIMKGENGNLMPNCDCTRAHIVTFLYRMFGE